MVKLVQTELAEQLGCDKVIYGVFWGLVWCNVNECSWAEELLRVIFIQKALQNKTWKDSV